MGHKGDGPCSGSYTGALSVLYEPNGMPNALTKGGDTMSNEQMVAELKKRGYINIKVKGGMVPLEKAPSGNVYYMYMRVTGKLGGKVNVKTV